MSDQIPTPIWKYVTGNLCLCGFIAIVLELDGRTFHFWYGMILAGLFFGSLITKSTRFKRWEDQGAKTINR